MKSDKFRNLLRGQYTEQYFTITPMGFGEKNAKTYSDMFITIGYVLLTFK